MKHEDLCCLWCVGETPAASAVNKKEQMPLLSHAKIYVDVFSNYNINVEIAALSSNIITL